MNLHEALYLCLPGLPGMADVFGDRIYPGPLPEGAALPALTYAIIAETEEYSHSGASGLRYTRFELSCWGKTYTDAAAGARAVKAALGALRADVAGYALGPCFLVSHVDLRESEQDLFRAAVDFRVYNRG